SLDLSKLATTLNRLERSIQTGIYIGEEEAIKKNTKVVNNNNEEDESIEVDEIVNNKESKNHPIDQVIGNLNQEQFYIYNRTQKCQ
ncbi:hypothetical protein Tco_0495250, partial [Tanacetum coccineum]